MLKFQSQNLTRVEKSFFILIHMNESMIKSFSVVPNFSDNLSFDSILMSISSNISVPFVWRFKFIISKIWFWNGRPKFDKKKYSRAKFVVLEADKLCLYKIDDRNINKFDLFHVYIKINPHTIREALLVREIFRELFTAKIFQNVTNVNLRV